MSETNVTEVVIENKSNDKYMKAIRLTDDIQKYVLGTKKNGDPRAVYDVIKDYTKPKKKKKKKKDVFDPYSSLYPSKKKKKKHKKYGKHWHL